MTLHDPPATDRPRTRRGFRLTSRVFWDMAIYMVGLGLAVGVVFPPFAVLLGVPETIAHRPVFGTACLVAGFLVGAMNYALCRGVVGGRMEVLTSHLRSATSVVSSASSSGDWSAAVFERIDVDSDDQIGEAGRAFNSLLGAVEGRKELEERLRFQAFHDVLTGLPNRAYFMERLAEAEAAHQETGEQSAVLFLDVDNLKAVNDNLGHEGGDHLIRLLSQRMVGSVRETDTVARLSGDEFAILLTGPGSAHQAERVAHRILDSLRAPTRIGEHAVRTGLSIGLATSDACAPTGITMLRAADLAMYAAKTDGKGRLEVFQPSHHTAQVRRDAVRAELSGALDAEQLELHYQPIVDVSSQVIVGFEALLRWRHPERGLVSPLEFIPLAEETGLIVPIGRWVLLEATRQAAEWQHRSPLGRLRMSVNVSVRQFQHPDLVGDVAEALRTSGLDASLLTLEITESLFVHDSDDTTRKLAQLKDLGVRLALDDFGTGYSSLGYLRRFPIDTLKIDKSFVDGVASSPEGHAVVAAITQLGQDLRLEVVAEGLETGDQVDILRALACPLGQGYHFSRPLVPGDAVKLLLTGRRSDPRMLVPA
ncbi:diguanylate cyclase (GGDEF) domain-containing protein [Geodermatophilus telluris]|uniref:Diguanylate cyclase (GGDEF) domain-containing protein n=1 Tax=Geodermatophilus telluris TaxID=1190417 RepID=A0A1G6IYN0_9ACTN|nr:EAL domain-containing protein [Geodermatophilus telluris]SDC11662.1 diguanylate cyclase (GGDEF) domain-containing protein [Geodermatophilus telluris]